jgi:peptidoglycan/LPS O-acetylase OafA/YrhL
VAPADPAPAPGRRVPVLTAAAVLVAVEAVALLGVGASVVLGSDTGRLALGVTGTVFFLAYGGGLAACARGLLRGRRWARAPVVLAQLIQVLVAWSFFPGGTRWVAVLLAGAALVVLVLVLSPAATRALLEDAERPAS